MTARKDTPPIFKADTNATPITEIKPPAVSERVTKVHAVHQQILYRKFGGKKPKHLS